MLIANTGVLNISNGNKLRVANLQKTDLIYISDLSDKFDCTIIVDTVTFLSIVYFIIVIIIIFILAFHLKFNMRIFHFT